jgi:cytochrome c-type biogenesis protein CcsB
MANLVNAKPALMADGGGVAVLEKPQSENVTLAPQLLNLADTLDNISYRIIGLGFPLLTIGIIAGAVWANEAWGSYWSWDPKETWALITWLVFAAYLHARITKGWQGRKPAILAASGFMVVWICYLGVNLLGKGLHSYGWFF